MSLSDAYKQQYPWRPWPRIFEQLPALNGQTVLDLGCGVGDQAAALVALGATVIGVDSNEDLLHAARARKLPRATFLKADLSRLERWPAVDGIWCSFVAAYVPDFGGVLRRLRRHSKPGGWIAVTEVDDLFGHAPLPAATSALLEQFAASALADGRHDFHMGRKLRHQLESSGFRVLQELKLDDRELAFQGQAAPEVLEAWRARFERLRSFQDFCGRRYVEARDDFLACLASSEHRSTARVYCCIAGS